MLWFLRNVARNSPTCISNIEITSLEFCGFLDTYEKLGYPNYVRVLVDEAPKANSCVRSSSHDTAHDPRDSSPLGSAPDQVQQPGGTAAIMDGRHIQDDGDVCVAVGGVAPHVSTRLAPVAANAHMHDRGTPPAGLMRQAPDHRVTTNALAPAASTPPILTSKTACQHCMVWPHALTRHLQPQAIQARERAQIRAIKDSIGMSRSFRWTVSEPPSSEDLDPYPATTRPTPPTTPTPSNAKSRNTVARESFARVWVA